MYKDNFTCISDILGALVQSDVAHPYDVRIVVKQRLEISHELHKAQRLLDLWYFTPAFLN